MVKRKKRENPLITIASIILCIVIGIVYNYFTDIPLPDINKEDNIKEVSKSTNNNIVTTDLQIYFFDVGQADSILITNNGHNMLIDAGNNNDGEKLVKYIKELGITKFDYVVGTHPHEDHIGGMDNIINSFDIDKVFLPNAITTTKTFEDVIEAIEKKDNLGITVPTIGDTFNLGEAKFEVMYVGENTSDLNDTSIVLKMTFGNYSYLFMGDASTNVEKELLNKDIDITVLKVGHHGSRTSTSEEFLEKTTPDYAIISVGKNNTYNHPSEETIQQLKKYTDKIYRTDELGTILLKSDGIKIEISNLETDTDGG